MNSYGHNPRPHHNNANDELPETAVEEPWRADTNQSSSDETFENALHKYVQNHGSASPELVELSKHYKEEQQRKKEDDLTKKKQMSRRSLLRTMGGIFGTAALGGVAAYISVDAAKDAAEDAAEMRVKDIQKKFADFREKFSSKAFELMDEMFKFIKLFKKTERWVAAGEAGIRGALGDIADYVMNRDNRPDKIQRSFEDMISSDPELSRAFKKIKRLSKELKDLSENFGQTVKNQADWEYQRDAFMKDFFDAFMKHLLPGN